MMKQILLWGVVAVIGLAWMMRRSANKIPAKATSAFSQTCRGAARVGRPNGFFACGATDE